MFEIRPEHESAFAADLRERFEARVAKHLRLIYPTQVQDLNEQRLRARVQAGIKEAATYGIEGERHTEEFVRLSFELGPGFAKDPNCAWAGQILNDRQLQGTAKVKAIRARITADQEAAEAAAEPPPKADEPDHEASDGG